MFRICPILRTQSPRSDRSSAVYRSYSTVRTDDHAQVAEVVDPGRVAERDVLVDAEPPLDVERRLLDLRVERRDRERDARSAPRPVPAACRRSGPCAAGGA